MYKRNFYLEKLMPFMDKPVVKVITGMRRVGKSCFVKQIIRLIRERDVPEENILYIDKESLEFDFIKDYRDLDRCIRQAFSGIVGNKYLLVDEIQEIEKWEKTINSFLKEGGVDIYITGSNAHLFSSELSTLLSGRFVQFPIYTLGFKEFLRFRGAGQGDRSVEFQNYIKYGGLPGLHHFDLGEGVGEEVAYQYLRSIHDTIVLKDIVGRNNVRNVQLLENIFNYVFFNIGNIFSAKRVADYLKSQRLKVGMETVQNYISYLVSTFVAFKVPRYDINGKRLLEMREKYFLSDVGLRHAVLGYRAGDIPGVLENIVFLELKRRGYTVYIGRTGDMEVDFIGEKGGRRMYIQIAYLLASAEKITQEFRPLQHIRDNYPKYVLSMDTLLGEDHEGIKWMNLVDFLLSDQEWERV